MPIEIFASESRPTYVSTWQGWLYVAFVIDVFAGRIVGWRVSSSMRTDFVLVTLEQALYAPQPERDGSLVCHSDRGPQYVSIRHTERLAEAGIEPSVGSKVDSYDSALPETINGLYKAELIHLRAPWKTKEPVGVRNARMGVVVQPPSPARAHRVYPAGRSRGKLQPANRQSEHRGGGLT